MYLGKNSHGEYANLAVHTAWSAWQAAQNDVDYINWQPLSAAEDSQNHD